MSALAMTGTMLTTLLRRLMNSTSRGLRLEEEGDDNFSKMCECMIYICKMPISLEVQEEPAIHKEWKTFQHCRFMHLCSQNQQDVNFLSDRMVRCPAWTIFFFFLHQRITLAQSFHYRKLQHVNSWDMNVMIHSNH